MYQPVFQCDLSMMSPFLALCGGRWQGQFTIPRTFLGLCLCTQLAVSLNRLPATPVWVPEKACCCLLLISRNQPLLVCRVLQVSTFCLKT